MDRQSEQMVLVDDPQVADRHVGEIFVAAADKGFRSLDVFVSWFIAGTAAALGLAAANLPRLDGLISMTAIKTALPWLGAALLLVLISKFFGSLICTMAGAADEARRIRREAASAKDALPSPGAFFAAVERAKPWPMRYLTGSTAPLGRKVLRNLMCSGLTAIFAAIFVVVFWGVLLGPAWTADDGATDQNLLRNGEKHAGKAAQNSRPDPAIAERR